MRTGPSRRLRARAVALAVARAVALAVAASIAAATLGMPGPAAAAREPGAAARPGLATARAALRSGRYEDAIRLASGAVDPRHAPPAATVIAARAEMALGRTPAARARLEAAVDRAPRDLPLRHALIDLLAGEGDRAALGPILALTADETSAGRGGHPSADDLVAIAAVERLDGAWQDANATLRAAVQAEPRNPRPNVFWGGLFLEKHALGEAETSFRAALAIDATDPDARVGMATVLLRKQYDVAAAEAELTAALAVNPRHAGALALRAEMALDGEDFDATARLVAELRRTNPSDDGAAWLAAARARLMDDDAGYRRERDAHARRHPADGNFFAAVSDMLTRHRRTDDARDVAAEGVAAEPDNPRCQSMLGTSLLRLGDEAAGVEALRRAWKRDPYDARTYNLLELFEKVVPRMTTFRTAHLAFRVDPEARDAVALVVAPFLEDAYRRAVGRYGFTPRGPITFELYQDTQNFAVRTVGLPGIGVDAVCFGRVITSQSPTNGALNWGMVLAHELAHVFAIELSRSRVPRWFTEGLAELETLRMRPEWRRHHDRELWGAARRGDLVPLGALSNAFVRARNGDEATRAYAEAAAALEYLDQRLGFPRIRDALVRFGHGERGLAVVAAAAGVSTDDLERGFREFLLARGRRFVGQYLPTLRVARDAPAPRGPSDPRAGLEARRGLGALDDGDVEAAGRALGRARALDEADNDPAALFLAGTLALGRRQADDARAAFLDLLAPPFVATDGYDVRVRLALAEIHRHDLPAAEAHLRRAIAFDPESAEARGLLVELLGEAAWKGARTADRLDAVAATLKLEPLHAKLAEELVRGLGQHGPGAAAALADAATTAIFIEPGVPALHAALGRALASMGRPADAAAALERALALGPPAGDVADLRARLADVRRQLGRLSPDAAAARQAP